METEPIRPETASRIVRARGATLSALTAAPVEIEVRLLRGILGVVRILGLRESEAKETRERVRSAIRACGYPFPERSMLINLAPADLRKLGPGLDLAIACSILAVSGVLPEEVDLTRSLLYGELALDGRLRAVRGAIPVALLARQSEGRRLVVAADSEDEARRVDGLRYQAAHTLEEVVEGLRDGTGDRPSGGVSGATASNDDVRLWDAIVGQDDAKRAAVTAACGGHHLLLVGPPGTGKSMLARATTALMPDLDDEASLEVSCVHSAAGLPARVTSRRPPFRAPHCSVTVAGMVGGGVSPRPGEMTLAHRGMLFLDELPHFRREVFDLLRAPMEDGHVVLSRASRSLEFPARFQLVAAMNPCPCGYDGELEAACCCSQTQVDRYRARVAGPVLDRIDLTVRVPFVPAEARRRSEYALSGERLRNLVQDQRTRQRARNGGCLNADLPPDALDDVVALEPGAADWLAERIDALRLSVRAHHRLLRVARTLADWEGRDVVSRLDLARALRFRAVGLAGAPREA